VDLPHVALNLDRQRRQRRRWIQQAGALLAGAAVLRAGRAAEAVAPSVRHSHLPFGPIVPTRAIAPLPIVTHSGAKADLSTLLRGKTSAVQLMFTGCSATCPIQGALFAQAQELLAGRPQGVDGTGLQFVSLSIDPLGDPPDRLNAWLRRFGPAKDWWAGAPRVADVERMIDGFGRDGEPRSGRSDPHTGQVFIVDRRGELAYRTQGMPSAQSIVEALRLVASRT
jgi:protein SCO1/2